MCWRDECMKFAVGYQLYNDYQYIEEIVKRKNSISEVYFSWGDLPNGRNNQLARSDMYPWEAQNKEKNDLEMISDAGINLNLLLNATCYGKHSQSRSFYQKIGDIVAYLSEQYSLQSVTTTSPLIASFIHNNFSGIEVRASVNMEIGTIEGLSYVKNYFDSFYIRRELNRNFKKIKELKNWCDSNGKILYALANSGCLNYCSAHIFHDNLVSHESEISEMDNGFSFKGICYDYLLKKENHEAVLDHTSFIRPEDIYLYEDIFPSMKLATRVHENPVSILTAYIDRRTWAGNILSLLEPNHSSALYPYILHNPSIKADVKDDLLCYENSKESLIKMEE